MPESMWDKNGIALTLVDKQGRGVFRNLQAKDGSVTLHVASAAMQFNLNPKDAVSLDEFIGNVVVDDNQVFDLIKYKLECSCKDNASENEVNMSNQRDMVVQKGQMAVHRWGMTDFQDIKLQK